MTRVDFYILPGQDVRALRTYACRIAEKAYRMEQRVFILTSDDAEAKILDDLLWTFRQGSFIPHTLTGNPPPDPLAPVAIGTGPAPESFQALLINLTPHIPEDWQRFQRIAEIIDEAPERRQAGRQKYRLYQERGAALHTHNIGS